MNSALFIALRRMRLPIIALIVVYAIGVLGLTLIPGVDAAGNPWRMSLFDAFYFVSYTGASIGFGELPNAFSRPQRLWVTAVIYLSVLVWAYTIGTLLALMRDRSFRETLRRQRFARAVRLLREPFYLICGIGETGMMVGRTLDRTAVRFVAIDVREERIAELDLQDFIANVPALAADARTPANLLAAGLKHPQCVGVLALTSDDAANLAVGIATKLLHPGVPVLCRALDGAVESNMASFGTDHIINPFAAFGELLELAVAQPGHYRLFSLLTGMPGRSREASPAPPHGRWIVCGYGRFGQEIVARLAHASMPTTIIDPKPLDRVEDGLPGTWVNTDFVCGTGTQAAALRQAGIASAVGIVAGTDDDVRNLSIAVTARQLNPGIFVVLRRNLLASRPLFDAYGPHMTLVPSELIAHKCLAIMTTPLLSRFLALAGALEDGHAADLARRIETLAGHRVPRNWSLCIDRLDAPAVERKIARESQPIPLATLTRDPVDRAVELRCMPLLLLRGDQEILLPSPSTMLQAGDRLLFAGVRSAREAQHATLRNNNVLDYVFSGRVIPGGWVWRLLTDDRKDKAREP